MAAALERYVLNARRGGGGWVVFFFHRFCDNCGADFPAAATSPAQFKAFADWLRAHRITVRTVGQVISGDRAPPRTTISCGGVTCSRRRYRAPVRVTLSATDPQDGLAAIRYTTNGSDPTVSSPAYTRPVMLRRTLTWDQGKELALHRQITAQAGADVFFCDAHSPWQRGSKENMNGLLRDYFPKGTDLSPHAAKDLARIAAEVNDRPRKTLG